MKQILLALLITVCLLQVEAQQTSGLTGSPMSEVKADTTKENFATLYVYRPGNMFGWLISYNLHLGDSVICKVRNNSTYMIHLFKQGDVELWAKTETKATVNFKVEFGKKYYLRCEIKKGIIEGRPMIRLIPSDLGAPDFANVDGKE